MTEWIQSSGDLAIDLLGDGPVGMTVEEIAHSLSRINRYTGHARGEHPYTVAQHSVLVSYHVPPGLELQALWHDAHETICGDATSPMKRAMRRLRNGARTPYDEIEDACAARMRREWGLPEHLAPEVEKADIDALLTERRDLFDDVQARPWGVPGEPWERSIVPWPHNLARFRFLERFKEVRR